MPTGYTEKLVEKGSTFEEFVWRCARATGMLFHMRDEPLEASPTLRLPNLEAKYEELTRSRDKIGELTRLSKDELAARVKAAYEQHVESVTRINASYAAAAARVETMLGKVHAWEPPTPDHLPLKEFMLAQLQAELRVHRPIELPRPVDPMTWRETELGRLRRLVSVYEEEISNEVARTEFSNAWMQALAASVPPPGGLKAPR